MPIKPSITSKTKVKCECKYWVEERKNSCYLLLVVNGQSGRMPSSDHIVPPTSLPETITLPLSNIFSSIFDQYSIACLPETITLLLSNVFSSIFTQYSIGSPAETITLHLLNCFTKYLPNIQSYIEPMYAALESPPLNDWTNIAGETSVNIQSIHPPISI